MEHELAHRRTKVNPSTCTPLSCASTLRLVRSFIVSFPPVSIMVIRSALKCCQPTDKEPQRNCLWTCRPCRPLSPRPVPGSHQHAPFRNPPQPFHQSCILTSHLFPFVLLCSCLQSLARDTDTRMCVSQQLRVHWQLLLWLSCNGLMLALSNGRFCRD